MANQSSSPFPRVGCLYTQELQFWAKANYQCCREWKESRAIDETLPDKKGDYPVILVDRVNHAQVAAGDRWFFPLKKKYLARTSDLTISGRGDGPVVLILHPRSKFALFHTIEFFYVSHPLKRKENML